MERELVPQWTKRAKDAFMLWKQISDNGMDAMDKMTGQFFNFQNFALMGKAAMETSAEWRKNEENMVNRSLRTQIAMFPLGASAAILRDFGAVYSDALTRLTKQQMDLLNIYVDGISNYFETLKKSRSGIDMMTAQIDFYSEAQQKTKQNVMDTVMVFEGVKTAVNAAVENTLDKMQAVPVPVAKKSN